MRRYLLVPFIVLSLFFIHPVCAADKVVGMDRSSRCTEAAFDSALNAAQTTGGGRRIVVRS